MVVNFKDFLANIIVESLHPELQDIVKTTATNRSKQSLLAAKIKDLTNRGEATGIEGNMPKGSSRAYMQHQDPYPIVLDGHQANIRIGTKVAIKASLDRYHSPRHHDGLGLGAMQNRAEGGEVFHSYQKGFDGNELKDYAEQYAQKHNHTVSVKRLPGIASNAIHIHVIRKGS